MRDHIDYTILELHKNALQENHLSIDRRIDFFSKQFIGKPYLNGAQGEGGLGEFDRSPLYRFDYFDCVSYINNVLALTFSNDFNSFKKRLLQLNYYDAIPTYENRFHFMSIDWNPVNQKNHFLSDITTTIKNQAGKIITQSAIGEIDKPEWFRRKTVESIKLHQPINENQKKIVLQNLHNKSHFFQKRWVSIAYLPLHELFDSMRLENQFIFLQFPTVCIIEIIRPNWNLKDKIGTNLHVSHIGFAVKNSDNELRFRHASSEQQMIVDVSMIDYLKNCLDSSTIKGINVQVPVFSCKINRA